MDPEWPLAERHVHHPDDRARHFGRIGVGRFEAGETLQRLVGDAGIGAVSYSAAQAVSAGTPLRAKWLVPLVKAPGTMIVFSIPHRANSVE
jgi:hypothetical protein